MKVYEATYSMGGIATGGFFKSLVVVRKKANVKGLLTEAHGKDISNLSVVLSDVDAYVYDKEKVLTTISA